MKRFCTALALGADLIIGLAMFPIGFLAGSIWAGLCWGFKAVYKL